MKRPNPEEITALFPQLDKNAAPPSTSPLEKLSELAAALQSGGPQESGESDASEGLNGVKRAVIAFSGGTDSSLLAYVSDRVLDEVLAIYSDSPTQPNGEREFARGFAEEHGIPFKTIEYNELDNPLFVRNDRMRCYHCKLGLFKEMAEIADEMGFDAVLDGATADDLDDYRPGSKAAEELGVVSPLRLAGLGKEDIREISKALGLETWDKPQMACLASRVEYGQEVTGELLKLVGEAEEAIRGMGYRDVRVRSQGEMARIEIGRGEEIDLARLREVVPLLKKRFKYVALDLEGYRTGSMNE